MKKYVLFLICLLIATSSIAGGSKDSSWQTIEDKVCSVFVPPNLDEKCDIDPTEQTGVAALCTLKVICTGDD